MRWKHSSAAQKPLDQAVSERERSRSNSRDREERQLFVTCGSVDGTRRQAMAVVGIVLREVAEAIDVEWGEDADKS